MSEDKKTEIKYFSEKPPFINRKEETKYFLGYFNSAPTNILFVYGPKSTGKTTLIKKIIKENLDNKNYAVQYINMRERQLLKFKDFKTVFFPESLKGKIRKIVSGIKINLGIFGWDIDDESLLKEDVFAVMSHKIEEANKAGIKPVIILDEFQYLKNIFMDEQKEIKLIEELFKFFIAITKQNNLAHVVCLTSDSYYMEELYNDTKLSNTSDFYLIDHLKKEDIYYWLEQKEKSPKEMIEDVWENLGGSVWEIWQVLVSYKNTGDYKKKLEDLLKVKFSLVKDWYYFNSDSNKKEKFKLVIEKIVKNHEFVIGKDGITDFELIKELVDKDIWFYDPKESRITANSKSYEIAFKKLLNL